MWYWHMPNHSGALHMGGSPEAPPSASASRWAAVCTSAAIYNEEINQWEMVSPALIIQPESISVCVWIEQLQSGSLPEPQTHPSNILTLRLSHTVSHSRHPRPHSGTVTSHYISFIWYHQSVRNKIKPKKEHFSPLLEKFLSKDSSRVVQLSRGCRVQISCSWLKEYSRTFQTDLWKLHL